jgi:amino acid adenylation domain-containing protein
VHSGSRERIETLGAAQPAESHLEPRSQSIEAFLAELRTRDVRLTLDGDKLRLSAPKGSLDAALKAALTIRKAELVAALRAAGRQPHEIRPVPRTGNLPLSFAQMRLWLLDRMQPDSAAYHIPLLLRMRGKLNRGALDRALHHLVLRHEALRTCIRDDNGMPRAEIRNDVQPSVRFIDVSHEPAATRESEALRLVAADLNEPFDLERGPMVHYLLLRSAPDEHLLLICMHHIAADGWSMSVAAREICAVYQAALSGQPLSLPPLPIQYADFAVWQQEQSTSGLFTRQLAYWQRELAGAPALLELPTDRPRPPLQSYRGTTRTGSVPRDLLDRLKSLAREQDVTLYMLLLSVWQVLLHRLSGQEDVLVGSPTASRDRPELEGVIGCFLNNLVLRGRLGADPRFVEFLSQVKRTVLRAFEHRDVPFDRIVETLNLERSTSHSPLFQVLFTLHSFPFEPIRLRGLDVETVDRDALGVSHSRFDLALDIVENDDALSVMYEYATDLFDQLTVDRLHAQYLSLLRSVAANVNQTVSKMPLLSEEDERILVDRINATGNPHDRSRCIHQLVTDAADRAPDAIAVQTADETLSYAVLEARANQLAHLLHARGIGTGALVGVCLDRTSYLPVALLGVLKAGAAYVPLDPSHPSERLAYALVDAQVATVVTEARFSGAVASAGVPLVVLDDSPPPLATMPTYPPEAAVTPADLAYVIYTSGSTGRPKGVEIEHRNVVDFLRAMQREPGIGPSDVLLAVTTPSFDIAGLEIFLPLISGATTVLASRADVLDGERLRERIESSGATMMQATPAGWRLLIDTRWPGKPDLIALCGGEALPRDLARDIARRVRSLWNMYGPTETTIWSTVHQVIDCSREIPIGHPIANTTVYVLDAAGRQTPIGAVGELFIGGAGVARGYRGRPELTAERFVSLELPGRRRERVYRTGDLVRLRTDLALEFVGRRDQQVKLRGHRIELGEIEAVLAEHPSVRRTVVTVRSDAPGEQRLVGYVVPVEEGMLAEDELRTLLRSRLPEYMVPSVIMPLAALPLTSNGKVDRKALPEPSVRRDDAPTAAPQPLMTDGQQRVAAIWRRVLRLERVGLNDNFFDIGGHSLLVMQVHAALQREFGIKLAVVDLFQRTTVAAQADLVSLAGERERRAPLLSSPAPHQAAV